jgi:hypothetical protein
VKDSPHPRFQLEIGLVKLAHATRLRTLDELINRLNKLESGLEVASNNFGGAIGTSSSTGKVSLTRPASGYESPIKTSPPISPSNVEMPGNKPRSGDKRENAPPPRDDVTEPSDFPDIDLTAPFDMAESDFAFAEDIPARMVKPATTAPAAQPSAPVIAGREVEAIVREVQKLNRPLVQMALEDAQERKYHEGILTVTFAKDDAIAKRVRDSGTLFRTIGEKLFGQPIRVEVVIGGQVEKIVDEAAVKRQELKERAMQNPAVRRILDEFRGEIVWVKEANETNAQAKSK